MPLLPSRIPPAMREHPQPGLEPFAIKCLQDEHRGGRKVDDLAFDYGISRRTVHRYLNGRVERIYVHGWTTWFFLADDRAPQRLTPWEAA